MGLFDIVLSVLGISPVNGLGDSMRRSKTLTIMVVVGLVLFASFVMFLFKMAGAQ